MAGVQDRSRWALWSLVALGALVGGCAGGGSGPSVDKPATGADGKADSSVTARLCRQLGQPPTCDVCAAAGWYGDGECDTFCDRTDSDCVDPSGLSCDGIDDGIADCVYDGDTVDRCAEWLREDAEVLAFALSCCDEGFAWCESLDGAMVAVEAPLPDAIDFGDALAEGVQLGMLQVSVLPGTAPDTALAGRVLVEAQRLFGDECDGVPTDGSAELRENGSNGGFLDSFLFRTVDEEWDATLTREQASALTAHLAATGFDIPEDSVFFGRSELRDLCGRDGEVSFNLIWEVETHRVIYLVVYETLVANHDDLIREMADEAGEYFRYEGTEYEDNFRPVAWSAIPPEMMERFRAYVDSLNDIEPDAQPLNAELGDENFEIVLDGAVIGYVQSVWYGIDDPLFDGGGLWVYWNAAGAVVTETEWWG